MPTMQISGGELYYEVHGAGPPLLLAAGLGGVGAFWKPQLEALIPHFRVVLHDHRGTGQSSRDRIAYSVGQMAQDVLDLADGLGIGRFHFVGHSTGAAIGQELMLRHAGRIIAAVLSAGWTRRDPWFRRCFEMRNRILVECGPEAYVRAQALFLYPPWWVSAHPELLAKMETAMIAQLPPPEIVSSRIAALMAYGPGDELATIRTPTLVIGADDDHLTPPHYSMDMHRLIPDSDLAILPDGGHFYTTSRAAEFNETVLGWLLAQLGGTAWTPPAFVRGDSVHLRTADY
jgi:aminoacrylate hydrolase